MKLTFFNGNQPVYFYFEDNDYKPRLTITSGTTEIVCELDDEDKFALGNYLLDTNVEELQDRVDELEDEVDSLKNDNNGLSIVLKDAEDEVESLYRTVAKLEEEKEKLEDRLDDARAHIAG